VHIHTYIYIYIYLHILIILHILFIVGAGLLQDPVNMRRRWRLTLTTSSDSSCLSLTRSRLMTCCRRRRCQTNLGPSIVTKSRQSTCWSELRRISNVMESLDCSAWAWKGGRWSRCGGPSRWNHLGVPKLSWCSVHDRACLSSGAARHSISSFAEIS
jgi:hypothetical protein